MDTPTRTFSKTFSNPTSVESHSNHNFSHHSPRLLKHHHSPTQSSLHTSTIYMPPKINSTPWHTSSATKYASPRLLPLISKFEALDADSLTFNIRDAQPPHLRLPGSRMGRLGQRADVQQMKTTREKLLTLFDRPGWGAGTLRGFRDGGSGFDDVSLGKERGPSMMKRRQPVNRSKSPQVENDNEEGVADIRPRLRRESKIRDRIKLFDGDIDFPQSGYNGPRRLNRDEGAVPPRSPSRRHPEVSPAKAGLYSVFPPSHRTGTLTPIKSYGYLRPKEVTPLPWRPLDSRGWEPVAYLTESPETLNIRGRPQERGHHSLKTPTQTIAVSAVKKVQITYQDPKRNVSEKVSLLFATRSKEKDQEHFKYEVQKKDISSAVAQNTYTLSSPETPQNHGIGDKSFIEKGSSETNTSKAVERFESANGNKIKDRVNLFSNEGPKMNGLAAPTTRMRNQSTPAKLPSHLASGTPTKSSKMRPQSNLNTGPHVTGITVTTNRFVHSDVQLGTVADQQWSKPQSQELAAQTLPPRKSSGISDKIQHFEGFQSGQAIKIRRLIVDNNRKASPSQSKRIQTWPIPTCGYVFNPKTEHMTTPEKSMGRRQTRLEDENITNSSAPNDTQTKKDKTVKTYQDIERAKQKIHARQERLNRRSRSRSRSVPIMSGPSNERAEISRAPKHSWQTLGMDTRIEKKTKAVEEARQPSKRALIVDPDTTIHEQQLEDGRVKEIYIGGSDDGPSGEVVVVDTVVAQCELVEPRPMRLAEAVRMVRLCRGRFGERSGTWKRMVRRSSEKGGLAA